MLKIFAIMGSPRKGKNTEYLLDQALFGIKNKAETSINKLYVGDVEISPCTACNACSHKLGCVKIDEMKQVIMNFDEADIILIASPIYFNSINSQVKSIIDRTQAIWSSKYSLNNPLIDRNKMRLGYVLCVGGSKDQPYGLQAVDPIMDLFFRSINTKLMGSYLVGNTDESSVDSNPGVAKEVMEIGSSLAEDFIKLKS